jgi:hypothetical protein
VAWAGSALKDKGAWHNPRRELLVSFAPWFLFECFV